MAKALTAKGVLNKRPSDVRQEIPDRTPLLYLIVQPSGRRRFCLRYRINGQSRKVTLTAGLSLAEARKIAADSALDLERGVDPRDARRVARAKAAAAQADTVDHHVAAFLARHVSKLRPSTQVQHRHVFEDIVLPAWQGLTVHSVARRDVHELVEAVAETKPVMANRTLAALSKFFNFLVEREVIAASPCAGVKRPGKEEARDRVLSDDEIKALWLACDAIGDPGGTCFKALLLLGQRRGEVAGMCRSEVDDEGVWHIPASRMKGKKAHDLPLSAKARALIDGVPIISGSDRVFSAMQFSHAKEHLDAIMKPKTPWRTHDLRRTVASGMARLGVPVAVCEKILAHRSGTFAGVVGVYQRYDFVKEMRAALDKWADAVDRVVRGEPFEGPAVADNVVVLRR
jgi:integrase